MSLVAVPFFRFGNSIITFSNKTAIASPFCRRFCLQMFQKPVPNVPHPFGFVANARQMLYGFNNNLNQRFNRLYKTGKAWFLERFMLRNQQALWQSSISEINNGFEKILHDCHKYFSNKGD